MSAGETYTCEMNQYPFITLSLKSTKQPTFDSAYRKLTGEIREEFERHEEIMKDLDKINQERYHAILNMDANKDEFSGSLKFLRKCLKKVYGKSAIILIDEYDVHLENAYFEGFYADMIHFIRSLFESALKTNPHLKFAVMTGCLRISKESIFTGLNNLDINSIISKRYDEHFGFTEQEVENAFRDYDLEKNMNTVREWYNGYIFGKMNVYNPWSFINYMRDAIEDEQHFLTPYWSNTSSNNIIRTLIEKAGVEEKEEIENLIQGGIITKQIHEDITYNDIDISMDNLWNFLFFTGYLKKVSAEFQENVMYLILNVIKLSRINNFEHPYIYKSKSFLLS